MSLNGSLVDFRVIPTLPFFPASNASTVSVPYFCILRREFMAIFTVCLRSVLCAVKFCFGQNLFKRVSAFMSNRNGTHVNPVLFRKFGNVIRDSINFDHPFFSCVSCLLRDCGPSAIFRRVIAVSINPIKRHLEWARPHILKECLKRVSPSVTNGYASTSIIGVPNKILVIAPLLHGAKTHISRFFKIRFHGYSNWLRWSNYSTTCCGVQS